MSNLTPMQEQAKKAFRGVRMLYLAVQTAPKIHSETSEDMLHVFQFMNACELMNHEQSLVNLECVHDTFRVLLDDLIHGRVMMPNIDGLGVLQ